MDLAAWLILAAVGALAGFLSSLLGVGGGIVMVPALHYVLGLSFAEATAASLVAIAVLAPSGILHHARRSSVDWKVALPLAAGGLAGVVVGDRLAAHLPETTLKLAFAAVMLFAAWRMTHHSLATRPESHPVLLVAAVGVGAGIIARLLGVGGGIITVPILVLMGVPVHVAVGSSLVPVFTNGAFSTALALADGFDEWPAGLLMGIVAVATVPLGAKAAHGLAEGGLRKVSAWALVGVAAYIVLSSL